MCEYNNITIRQATADDCRAVYSLICDMEAKTLPYDIFSDIFNCQPADNRHSCLVYEIKG